MSWILGYLVLLGLAKPIFSQANVSVTTSKGAIVGVRWNPKPNSGASYDAFLGIPYGRIPARFQPAVPMDMWTSPLPTLKDGPACPQPLNSLIPGFSEASFSENCLFLNVFTPVNALSTAKKFPVVAYIHGSAFTYSSSSSLVYGPDFIAPQGVILVTMNYRLGAAGFLTLGSTLAPGNFGLWDTRLALQWIQQEISMFGGDPGRVTLAGQSAGSVMTMFHFLSSSNTSSGMFQRAIAHSGSALSTWGHVTSAEAVRRTKMLADAVGCGKAMNDSQLLYCLQTVDIKLIVNYQNVTLPVESVASGITIPFVPVIDTSFGKPPFFTNSIENLLKEAAAKPMPLVIGFTTDEGMLLIGDETWKLTESHPESFIPWEIQNSLSDEQKNSLSKEITGKYFPDTADQNKVLDVINLYTDYMFAGPSVDVIKKLSNSTYAFVFAYNSAWAPVPPYIAKLHLTGVNHGADVLHLFYYGQDLSSCSTNLPNLIVKDNMVKWWTNFVKSGAPDLADLWAPASSGQYLLVESTLSAVNASSVEERHFTFWANLTAAYQRSSAFKAKTYLFLVVIIYYAINFNF